MFEVLGVALTVGFAFQAVVSKLCFRDQSQVKLQVLVDGWMCEWCQKKEHVAIGRNMFMSFCDIGDTVAWQWQDARAPRVTTMLAWQTSCAFITVQKEREDLQLYFRVRDCDHCVIEVPGQSVVLQRNPSTEPVPLLHLQVPGLPGQHQHK